MSKKLPLLLIFAYFQTAAVFADTPVISPEQADQITSQTRVLAEETKKPLVETVEKPEVVLEKEAEPSAEAGPSFTVKKIKLEGNTLFPEKNFAEMIQAYENREVSFGQLRELCQQITQFYRVRGFVTSRAY